MSRSGRIIRAVAIIFFLMHIMVGGYVTMWALEGWGYINFDPVREFLGVFDQHWNEQLILIDLISVPLDFAKRVEDKIRNSEGFNPTNGGFIFWYVMWVFPILWVVMSDWAPYNLIMIPWMYFYYSMDEDLWIDKEASTRRI